MGKVVIVAVALGLGGCASTDGLLTKADAVVCGLSNAAAAAHRVEAGKYGGKPLVDVRGRQITQVVQVATKAACALIGGTAVK